MSDNIKPDKSIRVDPNFKSDYTPTYVGIAVELALIILMIFRINSYDEKINDALGALVTLLIFSAKITAAVWCSQIAKQIDRESGEWGVFGFFLPAIAMIAIGFQKKYIYSESYPYFNNKEKAIENNNLAFNKAKLKDYKSSLVYANKAIELNPANHAAYDTLAYTQYFIKQYEDALENVNKSIELDANHAIKYFHKGYILKELNRKEEAKESWEIAANMGEERAKKALEKELL